MSLVQRTVCNCDVCGHEWIPEVVDVRGVPSGIVGQALPKRCPSRKCRSTGWNAKKEVRSEPAELSTRDSAMTASGGRVSEAVSNLGGSMAGFLAREAGIGIDITPRDDDWPKPVAELEDTGEPYRASEKPRKRAVGETLDSSLCRHSLYAATCPRCKYGTM